MQFRAVPSSIVEVDDPDSLWYGRLGRLVHRDDAGARWVDHLTGTEVFFPTPHPQEAACPS